ncbi:MAG: T9SS type A sorting domain-containing protein, partial [bacterium]
TWISNIFYFNNPDVDLIIGMGDKWMMSTLFSTRISLNNGFDWFGTSIPGGSVFTFTKISENNVFGGNNEGMFRTQNWGTSWENVSIGLPANIDIEGSCANDRYLFAGTSDHAVWKRPLSDFAITGINKNNSTAPNEFALFQNYPNPFNPETQINFAIPKEENVTLKIYTSLGKEIAVLVDGRKKAGNYSVTFNSSNLSSGVYIYTLSSENFVQSKRMILLK